MLESIRVFTLTIVNRARLISFGLASAFASFIFEHLAKLEAIISSGKPSVLSPALPYISPTDKLISLSSPSSAPVIAYVGSLKIFSSLSMPTNTLLPIGDPATLLCLVGESTLVKVAPLRKLTRRYGYRDSLSEKNC